MDALVVEARVQLRTAELLDELLTGAADKLVAANELATAARFRAAFAVPGVGAGTAADVEHARAKLFNELYSVDVLGLQMAVRAADELCVALAAAAEEQERQR